MEYLRESRGKGFPCSLFVGIRKLGDVDEDGNAVLTIDKNRHGRRVQVRCRVDWPNQRFSDVSDAYQMPAVRLIQTHDKSACRTTNLRNHATNLGAYKG